MPDIQTLPIYRVPLVPEKDFSLQYLKKSVSYGDLPDIASGLQKFISNLTLG